MVASEFRLRISNSSLKPLYYYILDINECEEDGVCPRPGRCHNILGSFRCICPRGFRLDHTKMRCADTDECLDDSKCAEGCRNLIGGFRCGCPDGYAVNGHNGCVDENECLRNPCGLSRNCFNTLGGYRCECPGGYQFDESLKVCLQVSVKFFCIYNSWSH